MANDYIEITHSCGHKETHHFTKSSALNKRAAKYKENELCSECEKKKIEENRAKEKADNENGLVEAGINLPQIEAVSDKQKNFADSMRAEKLRLIQDCMPNIEEILMENLEEGKIMEDEASLFRKTMENIYSYRSAEFWIDGLTRLNYMIFTHLVCLMIAKNPNHFNNKEILERIKETVSPSVRDSDFEILINMYKEF